MRISPTRQLVRDYIYRYDEITAGGYSDMLEYKAEGLGQSLIDANPYWWNELTKPTLYGSAIDQLVQAIEAVNALLENENDGPEAFKP